MSIAAVFLARPLLRRKSEWDDDFERNHGNETPFRKRLLYFKACCTFMYAWCFKASLGFAVVMSAWTIYSHFEVHFAASPRPRCTACEAYLEVRRVQLASGPGDTAKVTAVLRQHIEDRLPLILTHAEPGIAADKCNATRGESLLELLRGHYGKVPGSVYQEFGSRSWPRSQRKEVAELEEGQPRCKMATQPDWARGQVTETKYAVLKGQGYGVGKVFLPKLEPWQVFGKKSRLGRNESWYFGWRMRPGNALHEAMTRELLDMSAVPTEVLQHRRVRASEQWIFVAHVPEGAGPLCGAGRHVDRVEAVSSIHWQLAGKKRWTLWPHPDCGACSRLDFEVHPGEIFVLSNDVWDHATQVPEPQPGQGRLSASVEIQYSPPLR